MEVCDRALEKYEGFAWLTHFANYNHFPGSLSIVCVFDTNEQLAKANDESLRAMIEQKLGSIDVKIQDIRQQVSFDTEENCKRENGGKWHERFR